MQVRYRRIVSRNPREPHYLRKRMLEVCKPIVARDPRPDYERCKLVTFEKEERLPHPYEQLLAKELQKEWEASRMKCFFHVNPLPALNKKLFSNILFKQNMYLRSYNVQTCTWALRGTFYESVLHLIQSRSAMVLAPEPTVGKLLRLLKKMSPFILLGGIIDDHFLSRDDLVEYSQLPSLDQIRSQLSGLLSVAGGGKTLRHTTHHQAQLTTNLGQYLRQQTPSS